MYKPDLGHRLVWTSVISVNMCTVYISRYLLLIDSVYCVSVQLLANAVAQTATMYAEQVIKHADGSEVVTCFCCCTLFHIIKLLKFLRTR